MNAGLRKAGYKYKLVFDIKDEYIRKILLLAPGLLSVAVNDLNKIVDKALASNLVAGSISALTIQIGYKHLCFSIYRLLLL